MTLSSSSGVERTLGFQIGSPDQSLTYKEPDESEPELEETLLDVGHHLHEDGDVRIPGDGVHHDLAAAQHHQRAHVAVFSQVHYALTKKDSVTDHR